MPHELLDTAAAPLLHAGSLGPLAELDKIAAALDSRRKVAAGGLWGSSQALVLAALSTRAQGPWIAIASTEAEAEAFVEDLEAFGAQPALLAAREAGATKR